MIFSVRWCCKVLIQTTRGVYVISALALLIRPESAGREGEDAGATALNYAHLKYVCKVSISTLCKKFIVRFPIANSIKCFEFSFLLFYFCFVFFIFTVAARRQQLRWQIACAFHSVVGYIIPFFFVFSLSIFLFYFSFNSLLPFHFAYIKRSLPARALVLSPSLFSSRLCLWLCLLLLLLHFNVVVVLFLTHTIC